MSTKDKLEFVYAMAKHSSLTLSDCQRIMRYATTIQRLAETACNRELTEQEFNKQRRIILRLKDVCGKDVRIITHGDPRGCVVKLIVPDGYTNDWGSEGICVPTN
jgi:hypothetical protein